MLEVSNKLNYLVKKKNLFPKVETFYCFIPPTWRPCIVIVYNNFMYLYLTLCGKGESSEASFFPDMRCRVCSP